MGKIRTKIIGVEEVETKQKEEAKKRKQIKKSKTAKSVEEKEEVKLTPVKNKEDSKDSKEKTQKKQSIRKRGKNYIGAKKHTEKINKQSKQGSSIDEALNLLKKIKYAKFDESIEIHLNVDKTGLKGEAEFPHGIGKKIRVAVVNDELIEKIDKGKIDFDILVSHPSFMPKLVKYAKLLGPKGLMPNPKAGTISTKPEETAQKFEKGKVGWKTEPKALLIHQLVGKSSFSEKALKENILNFLKSVGKSHITGAFVKTTMSPAIKLNLGEI